MFVKLFVFFTSCLISVAAQGSNVINPKYLSSPTLSCADIKFIVDFHNSCKRSLANGTLDGQPKAVNMQTVVWDQELADVATNHTKRMVFAHNPKRNVRRFSVGENLFMTASSNPKNTKSEWQKPLNGWFNEYKVYKFRPAVDDPPTAHYTQLIWADTIYVGCGMSEFLDSKNWIYKYYVCNYGPTGNWYGNFPYIEDVGGEEIMELIRAGELPPENIDLMNTPCDLLCDKNQCKSLYGPNCKS